MAKIDYTYDSKKESIGQYNDRIASLRGDSGSSGSSGSGRRGGTIAAPEASVQNDEFTGMLQERLMAATDAVSSFDTEIESSIQNAIAGIQGSREASARRITSVYDREIGYTKDAGERDFTTAQEGQRGYAMQVQALRNLTESTEKDVNDLEQRKQEAIALGDAEAAGKIADLQLQSLQYKQKAQQDVFNNLLALGGLDIQQKQLGIAQRADLRSDQQFEFQKSQAIGQIALQYGLDVGPEDTLTSIIEKAKPFVTDERKLAMTKLQKELDQMDASIENLRADTAGKYAENKSLSSSDLENIVKYSFGDPSVIAEIPNVDRDKFFKKRAEYEANTYVPALVRDAISNDMSLEEINDLIIKSGVVNNVFEAKSVAKDIYENEPTAVSRSKIDYGSPALNLWNGVPGFGERSTFTQFPSLSTKR